MCDSDCVLLNVVAKWPGSTHDSFMWEHCTIHECFRDALIEGGMLLGDSGYPQQPWLMTPYSNPSTASETRYNVSQKRTRSTVERCIGILKSRFQTKPMVCYCFLLNGQLLLSEPSSTCIILQGNSECLCLLTMRYFIE